jgi:hypothetical protein
MLLSAATARAEEAGSEFFPLDAGSECVYKSCIDLGLPEIFCDLRTWVIRVRERQGDRVLLERQAVTDGEPQDCPACRFRFLLRVRGDSIDIHEESVAPERPCLGPLPPADDEGFLPHYRFGDDGFTHFDSYVCDNNLPLRVVSRTDRVDTFFAGVFEPCVHVHYDIRCCPHGSRRDEWWSPGFGLVRWCEEQCDWTLAEIRRPLFPRGDADGNGRLEITDAIAILNFLFLGTFSPACEDALDSDDSGEVLITDAIALLGHLFLGSPQGLPPPFGDCGADPTPDSLPACGYEGPCEGA